MRISDWIQTCALPISSVDSYGEALRATIEEAEHLLNTFNALLDIARAEAGAERQAMTPLDLAALVRDVADLYRSEARRIGKECVSTCRSRWSPDHYKKKTQSDYDLTANTQNTL